MTTAASRDSTAAPLSVILCDDNAPLLDALCEVVRAQPDLEVLGTASDAEEALRLVRRHKPDLVVLDVRFPGGGPLLAREIGRASPATRTLAFSAYDDSASVEQMRRAGVSTYIVKGVTNAQFLAALRSLGRRARRPLTAGLPRALAAVPRCMERDIGPHGSNPLELRGYMRARQGGVPAFASGVRGVGHRSRADRMTYELPPEVMHFVNREDEQNRALAAASEWSGRSRPLCLALSGPGGSGKTELAFRIARTLRDRYPDSVLYVDLDELRRDGAVAIADALGQLLMSLGIAPEMLAPSFKGRCKQYWSHTDGKRLVVVIDNARYGAEVVPLLPGSGSSVAIVASHGPLYDIEDGAAVELELPPLDEAESAELLRLVVRDQRLTDEPEAALGVVRLCSGLPAALHVAARWIRKYRRRPLSRLLTELTAELNEKGVPVVEKVWDAAYLSLTPDAALLYRLLADHPGPSFTAESAAAILGLGRDAADEALEELEIAGLLDTRDVSATADGRMRLPELMRAHARRRARHDGDDGHDGESAEARRRIVNWFLEQAQRADLFAAGPRLTLAAPVPRVPGTGDVPLADPADAERPDEARARARLAARWLNTERHALYASVRLAHSLGLDAQTWALCEPLWTHYLDHPHHTDDIEAFRLGVEAAGRAGDLSALVRMRCQLARPLWEQGNTDEAADELERALATLDTLGESADSARTSKLKASAVEFRGMLRSVQGDWAAAATDFRRSREVHRAISNEYGVTLQTYRLGEATAEMGDLDEAETLLAQAHESAVALGRERLAGRIGFARGGVLRGLGRPQEARPLYEDSLASARGRGSDADEERILDAFAMLAQEEGYAAEAEEHRAAAHAIRSRNGLA